MKTALPHVPTLNVHSKPQPHPLLLQLNPRPPTMRRLKPLWWMSRLLLHPSPPHPPLWL